MPVEENLGTVREAEFYEAIVNRFGKNCVYRNPKIFIHGQEKELGDIVILALPYLIVFQLKWKRMTSDDLCGDNAEVYRRRLVNTMQKAARQFKELASSLNQKATIVLPQAWNPARNATYRFPLELVKHVVPIVIIDFADVHYEDPNERFEGVQPVVAEVPSQIKSWGVVHSFIFRDFSRIIEQLFTVGDLLLWLKERERLLGEASRAIIGYDELTLFAIYLTNYPLWDELFRADGVFLADNDGLEHVLRSRDKEFTARKALFGRKMLLDVVEDLMVKTLVEASSGNPIDQILSYLTCYGRLLCCPALQKRDLSLKLESHLNRFATMGRKDSLLCSLGSFSDRMPLPRTAFYIGVASYANEAAASYCAYAYDRALVGLHELKEDSTKDEVLVLLLRHDIPALTCMIRGIEPGDYARVQSNEHIVRGRYWRSEERMRLSEWDVVRAERGGGEGQTPGGGERSGGVGA